jgi:hypothetical protein
MAEKGSSNMKFTKTSSQILDFINTKIPFNKLKKNEGIFETNVIENSDNSDISIGVSYEDNDNGEEVYIYNVFVEDEYINISSTGNKENKTPISVIDEIRNVLLEI